MTFRKDGILFVQSLCLCGFMIIICIILSYFREILIFALVGGLGFFLIAVLEVVFPGEFVTIDEVGIRCTRKGEVQWEYTWDQVIKLKRGNLYNWPSVSIVIDDHANEPTPYDYALHYFQLGRKAREALEKYSPKEISK